MKPIPIIIGIALALLILPNVNAQVTVNFNETFDYGVQDLAVTDNWTCGAYNLSYDCPIAPDGNSICATGDGVLGFGTPPWTKSAECQIIVSGGDCNSEYIMCENNFTATGNLVNISFLNNIYSLENPVTFWKVSAVSDDNPVTEVVFKLPTGGDYTLYNYSLNGQEIGQVYDSQFSGQSGWYEFVIVTDLSADTSDLWVNGTKVATGVANLGDFSSINEIQISGGNETIESYAALTDILVLSESGDTSPPSVTIVSPANTSYTTVSIHLNVSANETIDSWWYSLNGGANTSFSPNTTITAQEGYNNITVYANDSANNIGSSTVYFTVDTTAPTVSIHSPTATTYSTSSVPLNVSANEAVDSWWYKLNSGANTSFTPNTTITGSEGSNTLLVYTNDSLGNIGSSSVTFTVSTVTPSGALTGLQSSVIGILVIIFLGIIILFGYKYAIEPEGLPIKESMRRLVTVAIAFVIGIILIVFINAVVASL